MNPYKAVVYLDPRSLRARAWKQGHLSYSYGDGRRWEPIILAPEVRKFGEDDDIDKLIRKYGYKGRENTLTKYNENADLQENPSAAAHLIRFK